MWLLRPAWETWLRSLVSWLCDGYWPEEAEEAIVRVRGSQFVYALQQRLAVGDVADIYLGQVEGGSNAAADGPCIVKVSRSHEGHAHLIREHAALSRLIRAAGDTTYRNYLPQFVESFSLRRRTARRINVFAYQPGLHTLEQVHEQHPALDGRHLGWIFNRLFTVLGFCHRQGVLHGAVLPCHVLLDAASHGLQLIGWGQNSPIGRRIEGVSPRYADWYPSEVKNHQPAGPATDLFLAARCLVYLSGGEPLTNRMSETVPAPMQRFLATCFVESPRMRPDDAWALQEEFAALLRRLYGPPKFHPLTLT